MIDWLIRVVYEENLVSNIGRACLMEIGYNSRWWARYNHVCERFGLWKLVNLLWLLNISKDGIAMLGVEYDRNVWKIHLLRESRKNGFGMNEREQQYLQVKSQSKMRNMQNVVWERE